MDARTLPFVVGRLLEEHGLAQRGWRFNWDSAKRRAGLCSYNNKIISLSRHYVELNIVERVSDVVDTILHEIAHAIAGPGTHHNDEWKAVAVRIGARPKRCYDADTIEMPKGEWTAVCGGCLRTFRRHNKTHKTFYCVACGPGVGTLVYQHISELVPAITKIAPPAVNKMRGM